MKKHFILGISIVATIFAMASCEITSDDNSDPGSDIDGILGEATIQVACDGVTTETHFTSSVMDVITEEDAYATIDISACVDLLDVELEFPYMAFQFRDTTAGIYNLNPVVTPQLLMDFNYETITDMISSPAGFNFVIIAISDTSWFITKSGSINVTSYADRAGDLMEGSFNNVTAYYLTQGNVDRFNDAINDIIGGGGMPDINDYVKEATISGSFSSRRASVVHSIIEDLSPSDE